MNEYDAQLPEMKIEITKYNHWYTTFPVAKESSKNNTFLCELFWTFLKFVIKLSLVLHAIIGCFPSSGNRAFYHNCPHQSCRKRVAQTQISLIIGYWMILVIYTTIIQHLLLYNIEYIHHTSPWRPPWNSILWAQGSSGFRDNFQLPPRQPTMTIWRASVAPHAPHTPQEPIQDESRWYKYQVNPSCTLW